MADKVYDNRELSWLKFNERVLDEAADKSVPLMERLLFQSIYANNLDEFFMVRVGSLYDASLINNSRKDSKTKMRPSQQLDAVCKRVRELSSARDRGFRKICEELERYGICYRKVRQLKDKELEFLETYYAYEIKPFLNVQIIDKRQPFPFLPNRSMCVTAKLSSKQENLLGIITFSDVLKRVIFLPDNEGKISFVLCEDIISHFASKVFEEYQIEEKTLLRITRSANINVDEKYDKQLDFRQNMTNVIKERKRLCPVRLQFSKNISEDFVKELCKKLEIKSRQTFVENSPLDFTFVSAISEKAKDKHNLFYSPLEPQKSPDISENLPMIEQIDRNDILLSYPYESINPFLRLLDEAAVDENVVSIKMTLYRLAKNSRVVKALQTAAEHGKDVCVLVELRARFDEENNIEWSKKLQESGCHVIYGPPKLKVHSKLCLITRKTNEGVKYTVQIGTGNYNEKTSKIYTDLCLLTSDKTIAEDASEVFRALLMGELVNETKTLLVAPLCLQNKILQMMDDEIAVARAGGKGYVGAKLNGLTDKTIIDKLIQCSQAGVKVELIIRGICCLVPGVEGVTDNIQVRSIVGRYLEHSRIYIFGSGARKQIYISSADYMTRNTLRRVEVAAPIKDEKIKKRIADIFSSLMKDNVKARIMQSDGKYKKMSDDDIPFNAQEHFFMESYANARQNITAAAINTGQEQPQVITAYASADTNLHISENALPQEEIPEKKVKKSILKRIKEWFSGKKKKKK